MSTVLTESYIRMSEGQDPLGLSTLRDYLQYYADLLEKKEAVVFVSSDGNGVRQAVTWRDLYDKSLSVAKSLVRLGE